MGRENHTADLFSLILAHLRGRRQPRFRAGQYLTLRTPKSERRYSLAAMVDALECMATGRVWLFQAAHPAGTGDPSM